MVSRVQSQASTVEEYPSELPAERRPSWSRCSEIRPHLPSGLDEDGLWDDHLGRPACGSPDTYNGKPLIYAALASQKNYVLLYLMSIWHGLTGMRPSVRNGAAPRSRTWARAAFRFTAVEDIDMDLIKANTDEVSMADLSLLHDAGTVPAQAEAALTP